jgi:putative glutamine amidotransferase
MQPLIGVSPGYAGPSEARNFCRTADILYIDQNYLRRIEEAGGLPLLLPHTDDATVIGELAARLDGLLMTGGEDVHPERYGQNILNGTEVSAARDRFEFHLFEIFFATRKPILAICRGIQVVNVALGGTLTQDIPIQLGMTHHSQQVSSAKPTHGVRLAENSRLARIFGQTLLEVNSHHHQGIDQPAPDLSVVGWSEEGIPEAVEHRKHPYLIGVQWHPERLTERKEIQERLFADFVAACRNAQLKAEAK